MEKSIKRYFPIFLGPTFLAFIIGFIVPFLMGLYLSLCLWAARIVLGVIVPGMLLSFSTAKLYREWK